MSKLRDDIRKYEAETRNKVRCWGIMRSLYCPMSFINCPGARGWLEGKKKKTS